ncbi:zinc-binding alcohol dehydrogenase family protein [Bordetella genomosp. 11]|uniref:Zinc-type alcohol dehydrogenase-like protein n=1 Tax=Bordetella genomosp. 11 TaxID=1416808 RepID=A0A261UI70_9BORD|nr:zinc-binding alcohol dehydrogenase family protein [Bordetella genomosp. 11]OZI61092.1 NADPH:quinone reductase [Bordetella genomosp. 11]
MKAIVYDQAGLEPEDPRALYDTDIAVPKPGPRDLLVRIHAIAVNPVDTKVRRGVAPDGPRVLGWDAAGVVTEVGEDVSLFKPGDEVFYAGSFLRPGCNAEYGLVDERIAGHKPATLDFANAAALPLTSLTAWELLFDRLGVPEGGGDGQTLLIMGGAGGVGSILTQIASKLTRMTVIATASRPETQDWVRRLGAHHVIDHHRGLIDELKRVGVPSVSHVASLTHTDSHYPQLVEALAPQGRLAVIDDPATLDVMPLKWKCISLHWELMFTRSYYQTPDMIRQHEYLERVARLVDQGVLQSTLGERYGRIDAANLRRAHALQESGKARGKIVLEGFAA